ncbi:MAG: hypothetical protein JXB49_09680 [Bacteroidales bacterium]|nr:hypothetical protein [Bacteroidales bacterium]
MKSQLLKYIAPLFLLLIVFEGANSQSCKGYDSKCSKSPKYFSVVNSYSKGLRIAKGQKLELFMTLYGKRDYQVAVCGKSVVGNVHFKIWDVENNKVIYDNAADKFHQEKIIHVLSTYKIKLELSAPNSKMLDPRQRECIGLLISEKKLY